MLIWVNLKVELVKLKEQKKIASGGNAWNQSNQALSCCSWCSFWPHVRSKNPPNRPIRLSSGTGWYTADEIADFNNRRSQGKTNRYEGIKIEDGRVLVTPTNLPKALFYDSGINIAYPKNGVKGIYLSPEIIADETKFQNVIAMMKQKRP